MRMCSCGHCGTCLNEEIRELREEFRYKMLQLDDQLAALATKVSNNTSVISSAITVINGIQAQVQAAVQAALAAGATPAELQAVTDVANSLDASDTALANAIAANTPAATTKT